MQEQRSQLGNRLLGVFGLVTLIAGLGTLSTRAGHTSGGPIPVQITNPAIGTTATDNPALQPFQQNIYITIANGASGGSDNGNVSPGTQTLAIPAGKRLVVQTVSMYRSGAISGQSTQIFINASSGGVYSAYALPVVPASTSSYIGGTQAMTFYADGGTQLLANAFRNGTTGAESVTVSVSGYLVNTP